MATHRHNNKNKEHQLMDSLGISLSGEGKISATVEEDPELMTEDAGYEVVSNPIAESASWSELPKNTNANNNNNPKEGGEDDDLDALAELLPDVKNRRSSNNDGKPSSANANAVEGEVDVDAIISGAAAAAAGGKPPKRHSMESAASSTYNRNISAAPPTASEMKRIDSMRVQSSNDDINASGGNNSGGDKLPSAVREEGEGYEDDVSSSHDDDDTNADDLYQGLDGNESDTAAPGAKEAVVEGGEDKIPKEFINNMSSGQSLSTATQTHEVRMPMYLPTFKPATGCTNASDFIVRCFVARLRSGITVVKHGRSRWCKSRLRILHIHPDGCSLSWKPAEGEPTSNRRPPKLDLTQCLEVRHAWSPDPQNPMYTGTPILRQKCEAANAHKSFALIFPKRTVDITAVTADQCKVLMEGFSALCFRLQVADLAGKGANKKGPGARGMPEEDGVSTTASVTLTNSSTPKAR